MSAERNPLRICIRDLWVSFGATHVLQGVNFDGRIRSLALIGPSGSGKSTLLRVLGGLLVPDRGSVFVGSEEIPHSEDALQRYRAKLGFVFQDGGLFHHLSIRENITLPLRVVHGVREEEASARADELLGRLGLLGLADRRPAQLSGGQQQRAAVARALAPGPELLLLDEPTSALDPELTVEILNVLQDLIESGTRLVIVTHEMGFARRACEQVAFLNAGKIQETGNSEQVFTNPGTAQLQRFLSRLLEWSV